VLWKFNSTLADRMMNYAVPYFIPVTIAYFSMDVAIDSAIPTYSGWGSWLVTCYAPPLT
jgi:hypothetical protein